MQEVAEAHKAPLIGASFVLIFIVRVDYNRDEPGTHPISSPFFLIVSTQSEYWSHC